MRAACLIFSLIAVVDGLHASLGTNPGIGSISVSPNLRLVRTQKQTGASQIQMSFGGPGLPRGGGPGFNPQSLVGPILFASLIASGALGWIFNGLLFLSLVPLVAGPLVSWYIQSNLVEGLCPECGSPTQVLNGQTGTCLYCGSAYSSDKADNSDVFLRTGSSAGPSNPFRSRPDDGVVEVEVLTDDD